MGKNFIAKQVYKGCKIYTEGVELIGDLIPLDIYDLDIILGVDWLTNYKV